MHMSATVKIRITAEILNICFSGTLIYTHYSQGGAVAASAFPGARVHSTLVS